MWFQYASKRQLGELLERSSRPDLFGGSESPPDSPSRNGDLVLVWPSRPAANETPTAVIVENGQRRDLLAWAASFASSYRPFTAHVHVLNFDTCAALLKIQRSRPADRGVAAAVGAILGEALGSAAQSTDVSVNECARTYAYAMGRAYALGLSELFEEVTSAWQVFAATTNQAVDKRRDLEHQRWPWMALAAATNRKPMHLTSSITERNSGIFGNSARVLSELYESGEVSDSTLLSLTTTWPALGEMLPMLRDTREIRVQAFRMFAENLASVRRPYADDEMPFVLGYVASRLAPGSLEYFRLLRPLEQHLPGLLVWYGICAALQGDDFIARSGGLGRRLFRDLSDPETFPGRPRADISVWDLEVFSRSESSPLTLMGNASFGVELVPDILCTAPGRAGTPSQGLLPASDASRSTARNKAEATPTSQELKTLLDELKQALNRVATVQYKLERITADLGSTRTTPKSRART